MPVTVALMSWARVSCRRSYDTWSPTQAMHSGMMPAALAPMAVRANTSQWKSVAMAVRALKRQQASSAALITRSLPTRSPSGP